MKFRIVVAALLGLLLVGYKGHEKGLWKRWFGKQPSEISQKAIEATLLTELNGKRQLFRFPLLVSDDELDTWISDEAAAIVPGEKSIGRFLRNLEMHLPAVKTAKAIYAENADAEAIVAQLKDWIEVAADPNLTHLSVHVFPKSSWKRFRAVAVAVNKLPRFDPSLLGIGQVDAEVYNICPQCGRAHVTTVTRSSLAVALHCDHCDEDYDIYAMRLDGSYLRVTDLLKGYEGLAVFQPGMSKFQEMMAIWSAVLTDFTYTKDMKGANGHQDTWQTASETASFRNGDCEDTSIFMADWLISRGIDARVAFGLLSPGEGHAWCVARVDGEEYILESTGGVPDLNAPPQTTSTSRAYLPIAMFDRQHIYFRSSDGWTPRYWAESEWRAVTYPEKETESMTQPRLGELEISSQYFVRDKITPEQLATASGAAPSSR
jgi:predicted transglutaminase-like cysteine proteinase